MTLFSSFHSWKKTISSLMVLLMLASVAHAAKYRPPIVGDEEPIEEMPDEPVVPPKKVKKNGRITLVIPSRPADSVPKEVVQQPAAPKKQGLQCVRTLKEYNATENKHIKDAVGGEDLFTTWYDQNLPVTITIRPEGGAIIDAPGFDTNPRDVALCLDDQGPLLKFDGHSIRLRRGPLKSIAFQFQGYNLKFTTEKPYSDFNADQVFDSVN